MTVFVHRLRTVLDPGSRDTSEVRHVHGMVVGDVVPDGYGFITRNAGKARRTDVVLDGDHVTYAADMHGDQSSVENILFGGPLRNFGLDIGIGFSWLANKFFPPIVDPVEKKGPTPTYNFTGVSNSRAEGQTIPVVYGEMRVGGHIIGEYIKSDTAGSVYHALICVSEGPVHSIGGETTDNTTVLSNVTTGLPDGLEINDNPAENFKGVEVHVRLGSLSQAVVPGWEGTPTQFIVGQGLLNAEVTVVSSTAQINATNYRGQAGGSPSLSLAQVDAEWDLYGVSFDLTTANDRVEILIQFPQGLARVDSSSGDLKNKTVEFAVRYIELDSGNNPITTGGPEGDGYVRLQPGTPFTVTAKQRAPVFATFPVEMVDPQTFVHPVIGESVNCDGVATYGQIAIPDVPVYLQGFAQTYTNGFTVGGWFKLDASAAASNNNLDAITWADKDVSQGYRQGFRIGFKRNGSNPSVPVGQFYRNGTLLTMTETGSSPVSSMAGEGWHHVVWVYDESFTDITMYFDGLQVLSNTGFNVFTAGNKGTGRKLTIGSEPDGGVQTACDIDMAFFCDKDWTVQQVLDNYNDGLGVLGTTATIPNSIAIWNFDTGTGLTSSQPAYSNTLTAFGGWAVGASGSGHILVSGAATTQQRMKVRVEVLRTSTDSTNSLVTDEAEWFALTGIIDEEFTYPGRAYYGIKIPASEQLNTSAPKITVPVKGRTVAVWDGVSVASPVLTQTYTPNIAWVALDLVLDAFYGLGAHYVLDDIDLISVKAWADYSDQTVYDLFDRYGSGDDWTDMTWTTGGTVTGGVFGDLAINMSTGAYALFSSRYDVDQYVGLVGVNTVDFEVNTPVGNKIDEDLPTIAGGHRIKSMDPTTETVTLEAKLVGVPWTTGTLLSAHATVTGTLEGRERRHEFNGVLDTPDKGWPALQGICSVGFAVPVRQGRGLRFKFEHPRSPIDIVNQASIVRDSFNVTYGGSQDRPNVMTIDFVDRRLNWERSATRVEHASVQNTTSLKNYRKGQQFVLGITSIRQARVYGLFELNIFNDIVRQGSFGLQADALPYDVGDVVVVGHDLTSWATSGRIDVAVTGKRVKLDQDAVMALGSTYEVHVRSSTTGAYEVASVDHTVHVPPTTVVAQDFITLTATFQGFTPAQDDLYVFVAVGDDQPVAVTSWSRSQSLDHDVSWVEYKDSIFDFSSLEETTLQESARASATNNLVIPPSPAGVTVRQATTRTAGGYVHTINVAWRGYTDETVRVASFGIHVQRESASAPWEQVTSVDGSQHSASFVLEGAVQGERVAVAVRPMSHSGAGYSPSRSAPVAFAVNLVAPKSDAPTGITAAMNGGETVYSWTSANDEEPLRTLIRRGGWILGQPVGSVEPGIDSLKTINWASGGSDADGRKAPDILMRHMNDGGACSDALILEYDAGGVDDRTLDQFQREAYEWHRSGWTGADGDSVPPVKTDLQTDTDWEGRSFLEFSGSSLTASYETSIGTVSGRQKARRCTVEAFAEAMQDFPDTVESFGDFPAAGYELACLTAEGWVSRDSTRTADCTLKLEIALDGGAFVDFSPGTFSMTSAKIRMTITRPNTSYNVRIYRLHTRVRWARLETTDRSQVQAATEARLFGR